MNTKFKVGDKVVAVTSNNLKVGRRDAGEQYTVKISMQCLECGEEHICISTQELPKSYNMACGGCKEKSFKSNRMWHRAVHFIHATNLEEQLKIALELEDYELAARLRDEIKQG